MSGLPQKEDALTKTVVMYKKRYKYHKFKYVKVVCKLDNHQEPDFFCPSIIIVTFKLVNKVIIIIILLLLLLLLLLLFIN